LHFLHSFRLRLCKKCEDSAKDLQLKFWWVPEVVFEPGLQEPQAAQGESGNDLLARLKSKKNIVINGWK